MRRIIEWRPECLNEVPEMIAMNSILDTTMSICLAITIISIIAIAGSVILQIIEIFVIRKDPLSGSIRVIFWIKFVLGVFPMPLTLLIIIKSKPILNYFKLLAGRGCSDSFTNDYIDRLKSTIETDVYRLNQYAFVVALLSLSLELYDLIWETLNQRRSNDLNENYSNEI